MLALQELDGLLLGHFVVRWVMLQAARKQGLAPVALLATAAAVLLVSSSTFHHVRPVPQPPNEFVMVPGAATLPALESGSLVRMDVPVSELPALGLTPPPSNRTASVKADLIVGQDGLTRAARLVN